MCLLAVVFRVVADAPVVVGANREEFYSRGGEPPQLIAGPLRMFAGLDPVAGGTWLGLNERGLLVAVTNRPKRDIPDQPRSRGLLARDLLGSSTATDAAARATAELRTGHYAGCNFLCVDCENAVVIHAADQLERVQLKAGVHVLTANDLDDIRDPRLAYALNWLSSRSLGSAAECVTALRDLCSQNGDGVPPMVLRGEFGGTVSSSIVALRAELAQSTYWHAQGPPDVTDYRDYSPILKRLAH